MKCVALVAAVSAALFSQGVFAGIADLNVSISTTQDALKAGRSEVVVSMKNPTNAAISVVRWQTPLNGLLDNLFEVRLNGVDVPYIGRDAKWGTPTKDDMINIGAGQTLSAKVDLSASYDMFQTGTYEVRFRSHMQDAAEAGDSNKRAPSGLSEIVSPTAFIYAQGDGYSQIEAFRNSYAALSNLKAGSISYSSCSTTRRSQLSTAHSSAKTYAAGAVSYMSGHTSSTATTRYKTWFGTPSTTNYSNVSSHYNKIQDELNNKAVTYNCACDPAYASAYAYVNPGNPYVITLCGAFWPAGNTGTDSKAGTIIHESSHFTINGGTNDNAYGQSACKSLATSNPSRAVNNADSHEYFSENTPFQN
jgi:peptidyl-Lys metalloendopeptidase